MEIRRCGNFWNFDLWLHPSCVNLEVDIGRLYADINFSLGTMFGLSIEWRNTEGAWIVNLPFASLYVLLRAGSNSLWES